MRTHFGFKMDYYIDLTPFVYSIDLGNYGLFDKQGIPMVKYGGSLGRQYNPTTISLYALGNFQLFLRSNNDFYRERFLKMVKWRARAYKATNDKKTTKFVGRNVGHTCSKFRKI